MLRGYEALRVWRKQPGKVEEGVRHIILSLEYDYLTGQSTWNARRAFAGLEKRIRQSAHWETELLPQICRALIELEKRWGKSGERDLRLRKWLQERFGNPEKWAKPA